MHRRKLLITGALALVALPVAGWAHHGWAWTADGKFMLTGVIRAVRLGNPHGLLEVQAEAEMWTAEVGQPWRNHSAGLQDDMLVPGVELTLVGLRSADPAELRMKAEQVVIAGQTYVLYPNRS